MNVDLRQFHQGSTNQVGHVPGAEYRLFYRAIFQKRPVILALESRSVENVGYHVNDQFSFGV